MADPAALAGSLEHHAGVHVAAAVRWLFSLSDPGDLRALLAGAGFDGIRVYTAKKTTQFHSVAEFLWQFIPGSPVGSATAHMSEDDKLNVVVDLETELAPWIDADGLRVTMEANTGVARRWAIPDSGPQGKEPTSVSSLLWAGPLVQSHSRPARA